MASESSTVIKKSVRRSMVSAVGISSADDDFESSSSRHRYQVYRGMSPDTCTRVDNKIHELEEALERERTLRIRAEKELSEVTVRLESSNERVEEAESITSTQIDISRRREQEIVKLKQDFDLFVVEHETTEASSRKKYQETIAELSDQLEHLSRNKRKSESDRQQLIIEIETINASLEASTKGKEAAESKLESLEDAVRRLKAQVEELTRQNQDLVGLKAKIANENFEFQRQVQELDRTNADLLKVRGILQQQLDYTISNLDEETRLRNQVSSQLSSLQRDLENKTALHDEETEASANLRGQLQRSQADYQTYKSKYEKEIIVVTEELEETKRKLNARLAEVELSAEQARSRASKLEKEKSRLQIVIREVSEELETVKIEVTERVKQIKHSEQINSELLKRVETQTTSQGSVAAENQRLLAELAKLRQELKDAQERFEVLTREKKQVSDFLREALSENKDQAHRIQELVPIGPQLEVEKAALVSELDDVRHALKDALARQDSINIQILQIKADSETRLREKDEEIDSVRKSGQRAIEELQHTVVAIESKYRLEISRIKKQYEVDIREFEVQVETLNRSHLDVEKGTKASSYKIKELESVIIEEHRLVEEARQTSIQIEKKRLALVTELEDLRLLLDNSERARKHAESELSEESIRITELTTSINNITSDRRRHEVNVNSLQADLDEALAARRQAEERADRAQHEVARIAEELQNEQDSRMTVEVSRKQLETEIRQLTVRMEQTESFSQKEGKRHVDKLQGMLRDLETELEVEQRKSRDLATENRKLARLLQEQKAQSDEDHRIATELGEQVAAAINRSKTLKRQLEEAEEVVSITMNKYRRAHQLLMESEQQSSQSSESSSTFVEGGVTSSSSKASRSTEVTRETTRIVRV